MSKIPKGLDPDQGTAIDMAVESWATKPWLLDDDTKSEMLN